MLSILRNLRLALELRKLSHGDTPPRPRNTPIDRMETARPARQSGHSRHSENGVLAQISYGGPRLTYQWAPTAKGKTVPLRRVLTTTRTQLLL